MRIFILEDDPERILYFRERLFDHDLTFADSCTQIDRFKSTYDMVFFDHDLGGRQLTEHEDNGETFAKLLMQYSADIPLEVAIIHSYNPVGAERIQKALGGGIIAPFRGVLFNNIVDKYCSPHWGR